MAIADVEHALRRAENTNAKDGLRTAVANILQSGLRNQKTSRSEKFFLEKLDQCLKFRRDHPDLLIVKSDKGSKTVLMKKEQYMQQATEMLGDENTYKVISDPTNRLQRENNELVKRLFESGYIDFVTKCRLTTYSAVPPRMYFLPKHHKPNMPLRPITADINGPTTQLAKYLAEILSKLSKSEFHITNSYQFHDYITSQVVPHGYMFVSMDVVSLFTNTPILLVKKMIQQRWDEIIEHTDIPRLEFLKLIDLCMLNAYFAFDEKTYGQIFGTPMGSGLSPIAVEMAMDFVLSEVKKRVKLAFDIELAIKKYVDDIFVMIPIGMEDTILDMFNGVNSHIQFTCEIESNCELPFLDMLITREENTGMITTDWYQKPVASGRMLNYNSFHPLAHKMSTAKGLIHRISTLSSAVNEKKNEKTMIELLMKNGYPKSLAQRLINVRKRPPSIAEPSQRVDQQSIFCSMLYVPGVSERIKRAFSKLMPNLSIAFRCMNKMKSIFSPLKDRIPLGKQSNVIYSIPCAECEDMNYIGTTKQLLETRLKQHQLTVTRLQKEKSALALHAVENKHKFDFDKASILHKCTNYTKRMFMEELYIKSSANCVNIKSKEAANVSNIYTSLLQSFNSLISRNE